MQVLAQSVIDFVSGGAPTISEMLTLGGAVGGGVGASYTLAANGGTLAGVGSGLGSTAAITVGAAAVTGVVAAGAAGAAVGTVIYNNLPSSAQDYIGSSIAKAVNAFGSWFQSIGSGGGGGGGRNIDDKYAHASY